MAKIMGEVAAVVGGATYRLKLTMRGIAVLQQEFGQALTPIVGLQDGELPDFGVCLRVVELALARHHPDAGPEIADDILSADLTVFARVFQAAFPEAEAAAPGAGAPGKRRATGA